MKEALHYVKMANKKVQCKLCPHHCIIAVNKSGICLVRKNIEGVLYSVVYGRPVASHVDPIEKKPLYHYHPGKRIFSIGTYGCNLKCTFCQNCEISQVLPGEKFLPREREPLETIEDAMKIPLNIGLAYTYNEPLMFFEYLMDLAVMVRNKGMKNIMVTNGFINPEPLNELTGIIDAFNVDLKAFNEQFYKNYTKSSLKPVLNTITFIARSGKHLELTFLVIPGLNDNLREFHRMTDWIVENCGKRIVLHISRYFPAYKQDAPPTPVKLLEDFYRVAAKKLDYVYLGNTNIPLGKDTFCHVCNNLLISRTAYISSRIGLNLKGECAKCGELVIGHLN